MNKDLYVLSQIEDIKISLDNQQIISIFTLFNKDNNKNVLYADFIRIPQDKMIQRDDS